MVLLLGLWFLLIKRREKKSNKESTLEPKRFNPDGSEHYSYPIACDSYMQFCYTCSNIANAGYINFTVYHKIDKTIKTIPGLPKGTIFNAIHNSIHIYIPK